MTTTTAICIVFCTLIIALFVFFTIVYLSELKREKQLRKIIMEENEKMQNFMATASLPVVVMDIPVKTKEHDAAANKNKKNVN